MRAFLLIILSTLSSCSSSLYCECYRAREEAQRLEAKGHVVVDISDKQYGICVVRYRGGPDD